MEYTSKLVGRLPPLAQKKALICAVNLLAYSLPFDLSDGVSTTMDDIFKGVEVRVTAATRPLLRLGVTHFSPTVEIEFSDCEKEPAMLMTTESFATAEEAVAFGMDMARKWLEEER